MKGFLKMNRSARLLISLVAFLLVCGRAQSAAKNGAPSQPSPAVEQAIRVLFGVHEISEALRLSYYGENQIDKWMTFYFGDTVCNDPAVYAKSAPITFIKNVQTPSLLLVGDSDGECPPPQSFELWHALVTFGVPAELVVYPHEGQGFANPAHSRDVALRAAAWFNQYLK